MSPSGASASAHAPANRPRRALLLVNRRSTRARRHRLDGCLRVLDDAGIETEAHSVRTPEAIPAIIREQAPGADLVILAGGDGTFSRALDSVLAVGLPLGLLPMGNANDLARTLELPLDLAGACRIIAEGYTRRIDVGRIDGTHFLNVASVGLSVAVARRLTGDRKARWGVLAYLGCAWEAVHEQRSFRVEITCDGRTHEARALQIAVGNGRFYGGGMTIVEDAAIDDGRLDAYVLPPLRWWRLLALLPVLRWGRHRPVEAILSLHGREMTPTTDRPMPINVDGEVRSRTPARFRVVPQALAVFVPKPG